jgi:Zn-dependent protease with chaperone function
MGIDMTTKFLSLIMVFFVAICAAAQDQSDASAADEAIVPSSPDTPAFEPVEVPEPSDKAMSYYRSGNILWLASIAIGILFPAVILFTGISARIRDWAHQRSQRRPLRFLWYFLGFTLISACIDLPFGFYRNYSHQHAYDLSNQTITKWMQDTLITMAVSFVITYGLLLILYWLLRKFKDRWWLYFGLGSVPFIVALILLKPVFFDPLINDFHPMTDKALEAKILALADRSGIEGSRVFEVDKSEDTNAVNAYVTGFMDTKRIVLWDTIIEQLDEDELLFVMGHEMGHYAMGHVIKNVLFMCVFVIVMLYLVHRTIGGIIHRYSQRIGFDDLSDIASLPLILLMVGLFSFAASPLQMAWIRYHEHEADRFGLELTRENRAAATAFVKLQSTNLANPRPGALYKLFRSSHPPIGERVDFMNSYQPWETGDPLKYEHLFSNRAE